MISSSPRFYCGFWVASNFEITIYHNIIPWSAAVPDFTVVLGLVVILKSQYNFMISCGPRFCSGSWVGCKHLAGQKSGSGRYPVTISSFNLGTLAPTCQQSSRTHPPCQCMPSNRLPCGAKGMRSPASLAFQCCPFAQLSDRVWSWLFF